MTGPAAPQIRRFRGTPWLPALAAAVLAGLLLVWTAGTARAHPILQNPLWIEVTPQHLRIKLLVSVRELCVVQGVPITLDGTVDEAQAEDAAPRHRLYLLDHLELRGDGHPLAGKVVGIDPPTVIKQGGEGSDNSHFTYRLEYPMPSPPPARFTLSHTMVKEFPSSPGVPWDLSYAFRCGTPENPMKNWGVLPRDTLISFLPDGSMADPIAAPAGQEGGLPPAQAGLMALWAALGLNAASRRDAIRLAAAAVGAFVAGCAGSLTGVVQGPGFVLATLAGAGVMLASVDGIHRPGAPADVRRLLLAALFSLAAGVGAVTGVSAPSGAVSFALPAAAVFVLTAVVMLRLGKSLAPGGLRAVRQVLSLACAVAGLLVLFHGLGIRPWEQWFGGLAGKAA